MKQSVALLVVAVIAVIGLLGCGGGGIATPANADLATVFNAGVKKQIFYYSNEINGTPIFLVYNTASQLESDGAFLTFTDNTGVVFHSYNVENNPGDIAPPVGLSQVGVSNHVVIPISRILRIVQYQ